MFGEIRSLVGPFLGPGIKLGNIFALKSEAYGLNVVARLVSYSHELPRNKIASITEIKPSVGWFASGAMP